MWCNQCKKKTPSVAATAAQGAITCMICGGAQENPRRALLASANSAKPAKSGGKKQAKPSAPAEAAAVKAAADEVQLEKNTPAKTELPAKVAPPAATEEATILTPPAALWQVLAESPLTDEMARLRQQLDALRGLGDYAQVLQRGVDENASPRRNRGKRGSKRASAAASEMRAIVPVAAAKEESHLGWTVLGLGLCATAFGGALAIWSWWSQRSDLWEIGFPVLVVGQISVLLGIVLELDVLRRKPATPKLVVIEADDEEEPVRTRGRDVRTSTMAEHFTGSASSTQKRMRA